MRRAATIGGVLAAAVVVAFALARASADKPGVSDTAQGTAERPGARVTAPDTLASPATPALRLPMPPTDPQPYAVPAGAVPVSTSAELAEAVAHADARDIVLEDGVYARTEPLVVAAGHRLWARTLGGATLTFGLVLGGARGGGGQELHGLRVDVANPALGDEAAAVGIWGSHAGNAGIYDSWLLGNRALSAGVKARRTNGLRVQRVVVRGFTDWGIFFQAFHPAYLTDDPPVIPIVTDADISGVHRAVRGDSNGTAEAGLWAGVGCFCARIRVRDTGWSGVETAGNSNGGVFEDLDIGDVHGAAPAGSDGNAGTPVGVGVYVEHYTRRAVFRRVHVHAGGGVEPRVGVHTEWADPAYAGTNAEDEFLGAAFDVVIEDSLFDTSLDGIYLADATRTVVRRSRFLGQKYAAVRDYMTAGAGHSTVLQQNTYELRPGAAAYTRAHSRTAPGYSS